MVLADYEQAWAAERQSPARSARGDHFSTGHA